MRKCECGGEHKIDECPYSIVLQCPYCGKTDYHWYGNITQPNGGVARNIRNPHKWDGEPTGSWVFNRNCKEAAVRCKYCGKTYHVDCD